MFTLAGGHISPILAAAEKIGIKVVDTRHEVRTKLTKAIKHLGYQQKVFLFSVVGFSSFCS